MKRQKKFKLFRGILTVILVSAAFIATVLVYYTVREYKPKSQEAVKVSTGTRNLSLTDTVTLVSYNTGYGGLDKSADFFMDGGEGVNPESERKVRENMKGIAETLQENPADIYFLQEVDINSARSYGLDQQQYYEKALGMDSMFAYNYKCDFVPYPIPPIGHIESGIVTMTDYQVESAQRISLPNPFAWPVKTCNLKRCLLETRIPIEGSKKELVLFNLHLEAYDKGEGKAAQSKMLAERMKQEYDHGNYVIAGGDFNQTFEGTDKYPVKDSENWKPGIIRQSDLAEGFSFAVADNAPTCRLLNKPYTGDYETSQVYVIDGFIVSPNIRVEEVKVTDAGFRYADHHPVTLKVKLMEEKDS